ncbi:PAP2 superfamily protein [Pedobacter westerhofensis]|uniref:PAP2 superfamily protein n=1 Tax=Pedobacter westerhofensis TaxID=425512 RepID=A0A521FIB6_9SPHI|nr:phosphatase PAP2 family protein [Pedobacter westerhofensis]SMO95829.1 PAP2 superfamily protein [Pedobacter westerhofensis]
MARNFVDQYMFTKLSLSFLVFCFCGITLRAQETDSIKIKKDTSDHQDSIHHKNRGQARLRDQGKLKLYAFIPATAAVAYGFTALNADFLRSADNQIYKSIKHDNRNFYTNADDYLRYVPAVAVYGLDLFGVKGKNNFRDKTSILLISSAFTGITINVLKKSSNRLRPNRLNDYSFPSGHAATAFASAEFLRQEYGEISPWYTAAGYSVATTTAVLRLYKSYHWFSDVVAGAGIGILSTKFAYLVYPSVKRAVWGRKKSNTVMMPSYQNGVPGLFISGKF